MGWVAILKIAAMASNSAQGGFSVSISTTVQPTLLQEARMKSELQSTYTLLGTWRKETKILKDPHSKESIFCAYIKLYVGFSSHEIIQLQQIFEARINIQNYTITRY